MRCRTLNLYAFASDDIAKGRLVVPFGIEMPLEYAYYEISLEELNDHPHSKALLEGLLEEAALGEGKKTAPKKITPTIYQ